MELMSTTVARADRRSSGSTAWVTRRVPRTFVAYIRSHSSGSPSSTRVTPSAPPALLTTTSHRPSEPVPVVTDSGSVTSMTSARAVPPDCSMPATTSSSLSLRRPATTTSKPSRDRRLAMAAPMPVPPPVMRARGRVWSALGSVTLPRIGNSPGRCIRRSPVTAEYIESGKGWGSGRGEESGRGLEVGRGRHLQRPGVALDDEDPLPEALDEPGVVGGVARDGMRPLEHLPSEALGRLHRPQARPVGRADHEALPVDLLDGVDDHGAGHDRDGSGCDGSHDPVEDGDRRQAS